MIMKIDTGCDRTTMRKTLVPERCLKNKFIKQELADGTMARRQLVDVKIVIEGQTCQREVAVYEKLAAPVLLGQDLPLLQMLWNRSTIEERTKCLQSTGESGQLLSVTTRCQARQQEEAERQQQHEEETRDGGESSPLDIEDDLSELEQQDERREETSEAISTMGGQGEVPQAEEMCAGMEFGDDLFGVSRAPKPYLTRSQKREAGLRRVKSRENTVEVDRQTFSRAQSEDEEVQQWRREEITSRVIEKDGVLLRKWTPRDQPNQVIEQLVLPKTYRNKVLKLAHSVPIAGHLGAEKTTQRVLRRFYWPSLYRDVKRYCQTCEECQLCSKQKGRKAPMVSLPIMGEPFERIVMDVVGPLTKTRRGNRYILVVCDYATRYPEAIPLKKFTPPVVAEHLVELMSRHGIPREILTDQGTNFTAALLQELYKMLGVKAIKTTPYHPQTDGLVERFNQTLKQMLRKVIDAEGRDWDQLIPYTLFAYREVPQVSTGFSPFELVYGRDIRGPLDILKGSWTQENPEDDDILTYVQTVYDRLQEAQKSVQKNLEKAQRKQKAWYDQKAREMNFTVGTRYYYCYLPVVRSYWLNGKDSTR